MGSLRLSVEVWREILESDGLTQADIARICLVSRSANVALRPFLYRRIALRDIGTEKLQESLEANPSLGRHIEKIVWDFQAAYKVEERFRWTEYDERFEPDNFTRLIEDRDKQISIGMDILAKCTELRTLKIVMDNELNRSDGDMDILEGAMPGKGLPYLDALLGLPFAESITTLSIHQTDYVFSSTEPLARWIPKLINLKELTLRNCTLPAWLSESSTVFNESFSSPTFDSNSSVQRLATMEPLNHLIGICVAYDTERDTPPEAPFPLDCLRTPNLETLRYHLPTPFESPDEWEAFRENYIFGIKSLGCGQSVKHLIIGLRHAYPAEERARYWSVIAAACPNAECLDLQFDGFINEDGTDLCVKIADWSQNKKLRHMLLRMTPGLNMIQSLRFTQSMQDALPALRQVSIFQNPEADDEHDQVLDFEQISRITGIRVVSCERSSGILGFKDEA